MRSTQGDNSGCVFTAIIYGLFYITAIYPQARPVALGLLALLALLVGIFFMPPLVGMIRRWRESLTPCVHGLKKARLNPALCPDCTRIINAQQEMALKEANIRAQQALAERQKRDAEHRRQLLTNEYLRNMDPQKFECLVRLLYSQQGYQVEATPHVGDHGVDGYLRKDGKTYILQCKRYTGTVGERFLRDFFGTIHSEKVAGGILVTTGSLSVQARSWAKGKPIEIVELEDLRRMIDAVFPEGGALADGRTVEEQLSNYCPKCGQPLRDIQGYGGTFLGCSGYPKCRFTRRIWRK